MKAYRNLFFVNLLLVYLCLFPGYAQDPAKTGEGTGRQRRIGMDPVDDRVQLRDYHFADTDETLPYAVFVSSKVVKEKKAPLVLALHGFSGNHGTFMRTQCVDEAEKNGFILVGAMGYSPSGSFGMPMGAMKRKMPTGPGMPGMNNPGGKKETDPEKIVELSEKDAMNVLGIARREFNVDDKRIYLMGHSLGGGGALHLGQKYSSIWAGVAALAPGAFGIQWAADSKFKEVPLFIVVGEGDTMIAGVRNLAAQLRSLNIPQEYKELPGMDHGSIIGGSMPEGFRFFNKHSK